MTQQGLEYLSGDRSSYDPLQTKIAATAAFGSQLVIGDLPLPFISSSPLTKQIATKLGKGTISRVSNETLGKIMISGAPADAAGSFATNYVQSHPNYFFMNNSQNYQQSISMASSQTSLSLSLTINIAQAAIKLAQAAITSYASHSH